MNTNIELHLLEPEEKEMLHYIWNLLPEADRQGMTQSDVILVLDLMDDYLAETGLLQEDDETGEITYLDGEIDENDQFAYILQATKEQGRPLTNEQIQLIMDGELQYGIKKGYYQEED